MDINMHKKGRMVKDMMTIEGLKKRKKELGYTNAMIAEKSGVPFGTVQKIFSGATLHPRYDTLVALQRVLIPSADRDIGGYRMNSGDSAHYGDSVKYVERWPKQGQYTLGDYYALPDDIRVELIDGVIYDLSAPSRLHQTILAHLTYCFMDCVREHCHDCEVFMAPIDVRLDRDEMTMVQPDLLVLCHEDGDARCIEGAPELVLEILSESSKSKDCVIKLGKYMRAGVKEYWIVDPEKKRVLVYLFEKDVSPEIYSFDETIPVGISGGLCSIEFGRIRDAAAKYMR